MYEVVRAFIDSKNDNHLYAVGDTYPVAGYKPAKGRIKELVEGTNCNGKVYLKLIEETPEESATEGENVTTEEETVEETPEESATAE